MVTNEIVYTELERLDPVQFTDVLFRLLKFESEKHDFKGAKKILVPLKINVADGGEDGRIECDDTKDSKWITNSLSIFQVKACDLSSQQFFDEFFESNKATTKKIKAQIEKALDVGGDYVFFVSYSYNEGSIEKRLAKAYEAVEYCNANLGKSYKKEQIRILEGFQISNWVNEYINVVIKVKEYLGLSRLEGVKTIEEWGNYRFLSENEFVSNEWIDSQIEMIRSNLKTPGTVIRLIGHSGVGKSRLVYEALKSNIELFKSNAIYIDAGIAHFSFINMVGSIVSASKCTIIVDNCSRETHKKLTEEVRRNDSKCSLITIDHDVSEFSSKEGFSRSIIPILYRNTDNEGIIPKILTDNIGAPLEQWKVDKISEMTGNYPGVALRYVEFVKTQIDFSFVLDEEFVKKLLFGRDFSKSDWINNLYHIAKAMAIFNYIPAPIHSVKYDEFTRQVAMNQIDFITSRVCEPQITQRTYNEACAYFQKKQVLEIRNGLLYFKPNLLSVMLTLEWWTYFDFDRLNDFLHSADEVKLLDSMCDRLRFMAQTSEISIKIEEIFGEISPFGKAEVLNTELGSRLFRSLVEVNPEAMLKTLVKLYLNETILELNKVVPGRRNLIWSLEMLCFNKHTFDQAARILYRFAQAENEDWSNNSQGIFKQLFRPFLSGTEADFNARFEVLRYAVSEPLVQNNRFLIDAVMSAFEIQGASRMSGPERQGTKVLKDFRPTMLEVKEYWREVVKLLKGIWEDHHDFRVLIETQFYLKSLQILSVDEPDIVTNFINWLESKGVSIPTHFYHSLERQLTLNRLSEFTKAKIREFLESKIPQTTDEIFLRKVRDARYSPGKDENGIDIDQTELQVRVLAREFREHGIDIAKLLDLMLRGPQMYTEIFILEYLSNNKQKDQKIRLWDLSVEKLKDIEPKERNWAVLNGVLRSFSEAEKLNLIISLGEIDGFEEIFINLVNFHLKSVPELETVWDLIILKGYSSETISKLRIGRFVFEENFDSTKYICNKLISLGDIGYWSALDVLYRRLILKGIVDNSEWDYCKRTFVQYDFFCLETKPKFIDLYDLIEISQRLVKKFTDQEFINIMTERLLNFLKISHSMYYNDQFSELAVQLIEINFDEFWRKFSEELLSSDYFVYSAKNLFGSDHGNTSGGKQGILFTNHENWDKIIEWCKENSTKGPIFIATLMPIYDSGNNTWHPFANKMIDEFGNNPDFLSTMSANMGSFGWIGSPIDYYESEIRLYEQLLERPNLQIKEFARKQIEILQKLIERQKLEEEERSLGL